MDSNSGKNSVLVELEVRVFLSDRDNGGLYSLQWGRDSSVGIATRYGVDGPGIESR